MMPTERRKETVAAVINAFIDGDIAYTRENKPRVEVKTFWGDIGITHVLYRAGHQMASFIALNGSKGGGTIQVTRFTTLEPAIRSVLEQRGWKLVKDDPAIPSIWEQPETERVTEEQREEAILEFINDMANKTV